MNFVFATTPSRDTGLQPVQTVWNLRDPSFPLFYAARTGCKPVSRGGIPKPSRYTALDARPLTPALSPAYGEGGEGFLPSLHEHELVAVEHQPARVGQPVF